jgi:hypothetical protein
LGLLTIAEELLVTDPAKIASFSLPFLVLSIGAFFAIPHDGALFSTLSYTVAALSGGVAATFFVGGFVLAGLQQE